MFIEARLVSLRGLLFLLVLLLSGSAVAQGDHADMHGDTQTPDDHADMHGDAHTQDDAHMQDDHAGMQQDEHAGMLGDSDTHAGHHERPDAYAPTGVMGSHMHEAGSFMFSYRYMRMRMDGNRDGRDRLTPGDVLDQGFMGTPTDMTTDMHMFGAMYAPFDWLTLGAMIPYVEKSMDHLTGMGAKFRTESEGVGDLTIASMLRLWENETHHFHANFGIGFPTGSIDKEDYVPVPGVGFQKRRLPYPMQIGSGSYFLKPGITYTGQCEHLSWGSQVLGTVYLNENAHDYKIGNAVDITGWLAVPVLPWMSFSARAIGKVWGDYSGADPKLNANMISTADPNRRGGEGIDLAPGINLVIPLGPLGNHRVSAEAILPVYRSLNGPQLETDWGVMVGWQLEF